MPDNSRSPVALHPPGRVKALLGALLLGAWLPAGALAAPPDVHALQGVRIIVSPDRTIETGTIVMRDGVLVAVGADVQPPADARIWDAEGLTVYPGLIEPFSARAPEADEAKSRETKGEPGGHENPLITPQRSALPLAGDQARNAKLRAAGFTTALVVPSAGTLRGQGVLINLGEGPVTELLLDASGPQVSSFETRSGSAGYPNSRMGAVALLRQSLLDARWHERARSAYQRNPAQSRPPLNLAHEALQPVVQGNTPLIFESHSLLDSLRFARLAEELELRAWVVGTGKEYQRLEAVAATGLPFLLPLSFPAAPPAGEEDDLSVSLETLHHWAEAPTNPKRALDSGMTVAFTAGADPTKAHPALARAMEEGLTAAQALAALTTTPADLLGITARAGTVEVGKMANLVVVDGDLFVKSPKIREVWIDGRRYLLKETKPPEVNPAGTWEVMLNAGGQQIPLELVVSGEVGALSATMNVMDNTLTATSAEVSAKTLVVIFDGAGLGMAGEIILRMTIEGDSATGEGESAQGVASLIGTRTKGPSREVAR